ncbi:MAG TPA: biotin synthase BioB [Bdellovibrionota bacterium]|nr:biotin synthase BioB [Bdellovibrionota bacterium]
MQNFDRLFAQAKALYELPLSELIFSAQEAHRQHHEPAEIQRCTLLSIKTGGCPEDCGYCPQSAHYDTGLARQSLMPVEEVRKAAREARADGAERFCMGAAWRQVKDGPEFDQVLDMVRAVKDEGLEACVTLGMLNPAQARKLKEAGLDAYNHNLDTSREYYSEIIHTRTYDDRLNTLQAVREAGITVCSGGIIGMGESIADRCAMLAELAKLDPQPESVPINLLIPVEGTPLANQPPVDPLELVRTIAVARLLMPKTRVRLSAGRVSLSREAQALAFLAGANSIFLGEKLLTRPNPEVSEDEELLAAMGPQSVDQAKPRDGLGFRA